MAESASFQRGSPDGKKLPMSPAATDAQQRVGNGVQQHVAVGVAGQALRVLQRESANAQRDARFERV